MENKKMVINTKLGLTDFVNTVNGIAAGYFDNAGRYTPHIGMLNAMCVFYNLCVKDSEYKDTLGDIITEVVNAESLLHDKDFIELYNATLSAKYNDDLSFAVAYRHAMDIVEKKTTSIGQIVDVLNNVSPKIQEILDFISYNDSMEEIDETTENNEDINNEENMVM